jgi:hypothetical protein
MWNNCAIAIPAVREVMFSAAAPKSGSPVSAGLSLRAELNFGTSAAKEVTEKIGGAVLSGEGLCGALSAGRLRR